MFLFYILFIFELSSTIFYKVVVFINLVIGYLFVFFCHFYLNYYINNYISFAIMCNAFLIYIKYYK